MRSAEFGLGSSDIVVEYFALPDPQVGVCELCYEHQSFEETF